MRLSAADLKRFIQGRTLFAYDPETRKQVAQVVYRTDGFCEASFADGTHDRGTYGFSGDTYWTRYDRFRNGETNGFYLMLVEAEVAQAYHLDGRSAYLQSPKGALA